MKKKKMMMMIKDQEHKPFAYQKMAGNDPNHLTYSSPHDDDNDDQNQQNYDLLDDFLLSDDWLEEDQASVGFGHPLYGSTTTKVDSRSFGSSSRSSHPQENDIRTTETVVSERLTKKRVAFKTKSDIEILDDGFKWRKYGKKMVKNSPNPRNYYRCSVEGCSVKKRVERDVEDPGYVITTYEGVHNHEGPFRS